MIELRRDQIDEFPPGAVDPPDPVTRREFLTVSAASAALAGVAGCTRPPHEEIIPFVRQPAGVVPGQSRYYATAMARGGHATGLLVESRDGRPIKIEGNELHPASLGATDAFAQAAILDLYDPDRSHQVMEGDRHRSLADAITAIRSMVAEQGAKNGAGLRILTGSISSPTLAREIERLLEPLPDARWIEYEPVDRRAIREGARRAFGAEVEPIYHLDRAAIVLSLDSDFLAGGPGHLRYARDFASRRRVWEQSHSEAAMNRLYAVGPDMTPTSTAADHRLAMKATDVVAFARTIAARLGVAGIAPVAGFREEWLAALTQDLRENAGNSLVIAGDYQPAEVHALAHAINVQLQNIGKTVDLVPPIRARSEVNRSTLRDLVGEMQQGRVETIIVLDANPVYAAPGDLDFARHFVRVPIRLHHGLYRDETARLCHWHVPATHFLEEWGDARAFDGTASIIQPLIAPLHGGIPPLELISAIRRDRRSAYDLVRTFWREQWKDDFDRRWNRSLQDGVIEGTTAKPETVDLRKDAIKAEESLPSVGLEIVFRPDPTIYDGRFANNGWLQELPKPLSHITWDGVAIVGPATAHEFGLTRENGGRGGDVEVDLVELRHRGRSVEVPVWIQPGHAEGSVTVYLGHGRTAAGRVGTGVGFNAYALRSSDRPWFDSGLELRKTGRRYSLATTQLHHALHGRGIVQSGTLDEYHSSATGRHRSLTVIEPPSIYPEHRYAGRKWGMVIDLMTCMGCSACVVACQAENNIPVVGKEQVARGREMHWLRIDSYHTGGADRPAATHFQPVLCMHCEKAPCEVVCPVNATVHSDDGLNDMVYNRCVGTRYCSNNCPYKVRRFNFLAYADWESESLKPMRNPEVTVRSRGVMEKCTYCVQRIRAAEIAAEMSDSPPEPNRDGTLLKPVRDEELQTACQAACPTQSIVFGDLNQIGSRVSRMRQNALLNYGLLADELGTQPRTTYLAALRNPNPNLTGR